MAGLWTSAIEKFLSQFESSLEDPNVSQSNKTIVTTTPSTDDQTHLDDHNQQSSQKLSNIPHIEPQAKTTTEHDIDPHQKERFLKQCENLSLSISVQVDRCARDTTEKLRKQLDFMSDTLKQLEYRVIEYDHQIEMNRLNQRKRKLTYQESLSMSLKSIDHLKDALSKKIGNQAEKIKMEERYVSRILQEANQTLDTFRMMKTHLQHLQNEMSKLEELQQKQLAEQSKRIKSESPSASSDEEDNGLLNFL